MNWMLTRKTSSPSYFLLISNRVKFPHLLGRGAGVGLRVRDSDQSGHDRRCGARNTFAPAARDVYSLTGDSRDVLSRGSLHSRRLCVVDPCAPCAVSLVRI